LEEFVNPSSTLSFPEDRLLPTDARDRLILALDVIPDDDPGELPKFLGSLGHTISVVKIGWPVIMRMDLHEAIKTVRNSGKEVFLDAKFTDLDSGAKDIVRRCEDKDVRFLTVNHSWATVEAAVSAKSAASKLKIFTLTLLTGLDRDELREQGIQKSVEEIVIERARKAQSIGCDGVISSGKEVAALRERVGDKFLIVTPGIRPSGAKADDHRRVATPTAAIMAGANYLVVGRPITQSPDPCAAALKILEEMQAAFDSREHGFN